MWRKTGIMALALSCLLVAASADARPKQGAAVSLTVSVFNDAAVPPSVLSTAQARAASSLSEAGISLTWLDCGTPGHWATDIGCSEVAFPRHLSVRLVKGSGQGSRDAFGESYLDERGEGNYALAFVTPLACSKAREVVGEGDLLGYVIVHELGHLLLGPDSHSPAGVMRAVWQFEDLKQAARGRLTFTPEQMERMQSRFLSANARRNAGPMAPAGSRGK